MSSCSRPPLEVADVFRLSGTQYKVSDQFRPSFPFASPRKMVPVDFTNGDLIDGNKKTNTRAMAGID